MPIAQHRLRDCKALAVYVKCQKQFISLWGNTTQNSDAAGSTLKMISWSLSGLITDLMPTVGIIMYTCMHARVSATSTAKLH